MKASFLNRNTVRVEDANYVNRMIQHALSSNLRLTLFSYKLLLVGIFLPASPPCICKDIVFALHLLF